MGLQVTCPECAGNMMVIAPSETQCEDCMLRILVPSGGARLAAPERDERIFLVLSDFRRKWGHLHSGGTLQKETLGWMVERLETLLSLPE